MSEAGLVEQLMEIVGLGDRNHAYLLLQASNFDVSAACSLHLSEDLNLSSDISASYNISSGAGRHPNEEPQDLYRDEEEDYVDEEEYKPPSVSSKRKKNNRNNKKTSRGKRRAGAGNDEDCISPDHLAELKGINGDATRPPSPSATRDGYDSDGVRAADNVKRQRLLRDCSTAGEYRHDRSVPSTRSKSRGNDVDAEHRGFPQEATPSSSFIGGGGESYLYAPPYDLLAKGSLEEVRKMCKPIEGWGHPSTRWLLVNIQQEDEFTCHELNRDVWSNDIVKEIVNSSFLLWQQTHTINEGGASDNDSAANDFVKRYRVNAFSYLGIIAFPYLGIIDPRTGLEEWSWAKNVRRKSPKSPVQEHDVQRIHVDILISSLTDFLIEKPYPGKSKPSSSASFSTFASVSGSADSFQQYVDVDVDIEAGVHPDQEQDKDNEPGFSLTLMCSAFVPPPADTSTTTAATDSNSAACTPDMQSLSTIQLKIQLPPPAASFLLRVPGNYTVRELLGEIGRAMLPSSTSSSSSSSSSSSFEEDSAGAGARESRRVEVSYGHPLMHLSEQLAVAVAVCAEGGDADVPAMEKAESTMLDQVNIRSGERLAVKFLQGKV